MTSPMLLLTAVVPFSHVWKDWQSLRLNARSKRRLTVHPSLFPCLTNQAFLLILGNLQNPDDAFMTPVEPPARSALYSCQLNTQEIIDMIQAVKKDNLSSEKTAEAWAVLPNIVTKLPKMKLSSLKIQVFYHGTTLNLLERLIELERRRERALLHILQIIGLKYCWKIGRKKW